MQAGYASQSAIASRNKSFRGAGRRKAGGTGLFFEILPNIGGML
jgi:hypothetical protein